MRVKIANVTEVIHPLFASYVISGIPRMAGVWPHSPETSIDSWLFQKTTIRQPFLKTIEPFAGGLLLGQLRVEG